MSSIQTLERRIALLETRLAEIDSGYGETLYRLHRESIRTRLELGSLLDHFNLPRATDEQIDDVIDNESR